MVESLYQRRIIGIVRQLFPGCIILKNDSSYLQGIPDIIILYEDMWAALEFKRSKNASHRPNQDYYIELLDSMSFASFVNPENEEDVLHDLQLAFGIAEPACIS